MISDEVIDQVPGCKELIGWFGSWPRFLDSEVLSICLNRSGISEVEVYTFEWTGQVAADGAYHLHKHVVVTFLLEKVSDCELVGFNHQNVINGLDLEARLGHYHLQLHNIFGVGGSIDAKTVRIQFAPGEPISSGKGSALSPSTASPQ